MPHQEINASDEEPLSCVVVRGERGPPAMILTQHYLACLSHASYLIGDEATGRAVVVDPRRDVEIYLREARQRGLRIERVIETHVHADFLSGHLELADRAGAVICYGAGAEVGFPIEALHDGQRLSLGETTLEILATPGHTPESICVVVWEHPGDRAPHGVLTGDTLFVGDVGRPDLLASADPDLSAGALARRLYRSLHDKLLTLPDATRVYPAHGAGSACGKALSSETTSTIGAERRTNYALQDMTEDAFIAAVTEGQPARPRYFAFDARVNREPHPLLDEHPPQLLGLADVLARQQAGAILLDPREPADFAAAHLPGAISVGLQGRFAEWAGDVLPPDRDIVLAGDPALAAEAKIRLGRVGLDRVVGQLADPASVLAGRPELAQRSSRLSVGELAGLRGREPRLQLVDVRAAAETAEGTLPGAVQIPLAVLADSLDTLDPGRPMVVYCASGYRSVIAASTLAAAGFPDVSDLLGGYRAWGAAGLPVARGAGASVAAGTPPAPEQGMLVHRADPLNCETASLELIGGVVTPSARFYVRNHFPVPGIDAAGWRLEVTGLVERPLTLTLRELSRMPAETRVVTLECAGNGRYTLEPAVEGEPWRLGAVSTAEWTGIPVGEVLDRAGVLPAARELVFRGADHGAVQGCPGEIHFERSLPPDAARDSHAMLAYAMNGEALPPRHGYPLRLVVPGWYGVASVKWLTAIEVAGRPFTGYFQADKYWYETGDSRWPVTLQRVRALITDPRDGADLPAGDITVRGIAWSGAAAIARVDVSIDKGPWQAARLLGDRHRDSWQSWELPTSLTRPGRHSIRARATDLAGRTQPGRAPWNRHGYGNNAIQQVLARVAPAEPG